MKKLIFSVLLVLVFMISGCRPEGGYIECFDGLIKDEEGTLNIWIPEEGNVLLPEIEETYLINHHEHYDLQEGDWGDICFKRTKNDIYINETSPKTFVIDAITFSVSEDKAHNIQMIETEDNTEVTLELSSEFDDFDQGDNLYIHAYKRGNVEYYNNYPIPFKDETHITLLIPTAEVARFMEIYIFTGAEYTDSRDFD